MDGLSLLLWKLLDLLKEFIIFYILILLGEWFVQKRGYNLFERAWIITVFVLSVLCIFAWKYFGRWLIFF